jgi:predicted ATP-dependent protease
MRSARVIQPRELTAEQLRRRANTSQFSFASTAEAPDLDRIIGQERAARAIEFGIDIPSAGYNVFATGPTGAGKTSIIRRYLERKAATRPVPPDWGYVYNFADPDRPLALRLPPAGGVRLRDQMNALLNQVAETIETTFSSDQYAESRNAIGRELYHQRGEMLRELEATVREQGFALARTPMGMILAPMVDGQAITQEQFAELPEKIAAFAERGAALQEHMERTMRHIRELEETAQGKLAELEEQIASAAIRPFFSRLAEEYAAWPDVLEHLEAVQAHIAAHVSDLKAQQGSGENPEAKSPVETWLRADHGGPYDRYRINVVVDNQGLTGAPVIEETSPTYMHLIGHVDMRAEFGTLVTDFQEIKAGALHRANGGYLLLDARVLLRQPLAWEALKQALRNRSVRIEDLNRQLGVLATTTIVPEPVPLDVKVVLIGDPMTYYMLYSLDEQFEKLFKVRADFAVQMDWSDENEAQIVRFIHHQCEEDGLPHFDLSAVAQVVEYSARLVEDQRKLTTRFAHISNIVVEAAYWARQAGHNMVTADDVTRAIDERVYRSNQYEELLREMITDGAIMLDTTGSAVGQVNGLSVVILGDYMFGRPTRITAQTFQGRAGVVNIEREARMSGRIHDKGVLILSGFLGGRYAQDKPLSLSATVAFEQSYEGVEGDSASSTELYALLSSLADLPIRQSIAVTGSVNQRGEIQAVGGVTAKVEGFFDVCRAMPGGLNGEQGVILPEANV